MNLIEIPVLDKGFVHLVDKMGSDLTTVNSARVSFDSYSDALQDRDVKLTNYLASHQHTSPFRHAYLQLRFKAPLFVARQLWKHIIGVEPEFDLEDNFRGFSGGFKDTGWNELSQRYVQMDEEFYVPQNWRAQSTSNKQGSAGNLGEPVESELRELFQKAINSAYSTYKYFLEVGVAKEQARIMLPQNIYTQWYWTMSLQAALHVVELRAKPDAQWETQKFGFAVKDILKETFPIALQAWENKG